MRLEIWLLAEVDGTHDRDGMNCFTHQEIVAVAACSAGCGRALCGACATRHDPPTCAACAAKLARPLQEMILDQTDRPLEARTKTAIIEST